MELNHKLYGTQANLARSNYNQTRKKRQDDEQGVKEDGYFEEQRRQYNKRVRKFRMPASLISGGYRTLESSSRGAKKIIGEGGELSSFQKLATSDVVSSGLASPVGGATLGLVKGINDKNQTLATKQMASQLGNAGKAYRASKIYSKAGRIVAAPMIASMTMGQGKGGFSSLTSQLTGGSGAAVAAIIAAQVAAGIAKGVATRKLQPKKISESQVVRQYNVSAQFQGHITRLLSTGELKPVDMIKLQYLGIIADRVGPLSSIYKNMLDEKSEKTAHQKQGADNYQKK